MAFLRKVGNYELTESLGAGAFGEVFRGTNTRGEVVAIKCIPKDRLDSRLARYLEREIATLQGINSPYVTQLYEVIQTGKNIYLAMEYCAGKDLEKTMRKLAAVPMHLARRWLTNIVDAFLALKEKKIMHRDLKPANVILTHTDLEQAYAKLADFGLAKFDGNNGARIDQSTVGSPLYMAPEILDQLPYNSKVDVWSFGVLASTLLGTRLFKGIANMYVLQERQRDCQFQGLNLPTDAEDMLRLALTYDPQSRPSFEQLRQMPFFQPTPATIPLSIPIGFSHSEGANGPLIDADAMTGQKLRIGYCLHKEIMAAWELGKAKYQENKNLLALGIFQICLKWKMKCKEEIQAYLGQYRDADLEQLFTEAETAIQQAEERLTDEDLSRSVVQYNDEGCKISPRLFYAEAQEVSNSAFYSQIPPEAKLKQYNQALGLCLLVKEDQPNAQQQELVDWLCATIGDIEKLIVS